MSLSSCHCKHRPAFVCIRSLCKHWEGCGVLLQKAAQARALSGRVGNGYGWSLFLETDGLLRCQDDTVLPPASLQALQRVSAITLCAQQHSSQYRPGGWAEHLINSVSFWLQRQLPAQELRGILRWWLKKYLPSKGKTKIWERHFSFLLISPERTQVLWEAVKAAQLLRSRVTAGLSFWNSIRGGRLGLGTEPVGARGYLSMATARRIQVAEHSFSSSLQPDAGEGFHRRTPPPWPLVANFKEMIQLCLFWYTKQKYSPSIFIRA